MARFISQETFDDVVKENIVDFCMNPDKAKEETIRQFEAQGINLSNIIKDLSINSETGQPILIETIDKLKTSTSEERKDSEELLGCLKVLDEECSKSIPHRVLAGKNGAHDALVTLIEQELSGRSNFEVVEECLKAVNSLTNKQPDLFDVEALAVILKLLLLQNEDIICLTLQWLQKASIMHEINRQNIMNAGIINYLKPMIRKESNLKVIKNVSAVFRYLVLDDDIRVEFGCAHEHARAISSAVIVDLTRLLAELKDADVLADLLLTLSALAVRQEFCTIIEDAGGLKFIFDIMTSNINTARLNCEALKLLRALAGNDTVKIHIVQQGIPPIIKELLIVHMSNEKIVTAALACISTLTLRVKENSIAFYEEGIVEVVVEALNLHSKNKIIQRNGAWAIRNMVSRSREQCKSWLSFGVEELLNSAMREHPSIQQDVKAALRDLGCKVELKEEWTGKAEKKISKV